MSDDFSTDSNEVPYVQALIGWTTLIVILLSVLALGANRPVSWSLLAMFLMPLFLLQILCDLIRGLPKHVGWLWLPGAMFVAVLAWSFVQTMPAFRPELAHPVWSLVPQATPRISADPLEGYQHILRLSAYGMVFWIIFRSAAVVDRGMMFVGTIAIWISLLALYGLGALAVGQNPIVGENAATYVTSTFVNRNAFATYAVFGSLANLAMFLHLHKSVRFDSDQGRQILRDFLESFFKGGWIFAVGFLICLASLFATQSRAGSAAGILGLLTYLAIYRVRRENSSSYAWLTMVAIVIFVVTMLTASLASRILATGAESPRFVIYPKIIEAIQDRPLLGNGLGSFHNVFRAHVPLDAAQAEWRQAHNSYLENAFEMGVPAAAVFYLALLILTFLVARGSIVRRNHRSFSTLALACVVAAGFHAVFDFSLQMPALATLFAAILALGCAQAWNRKSVRPPARHRRPHSHTSIDIEPARPGSGFDAPPKPQGVSQKPPVDPDP